MTNTSTSNGSTNSYWSHKNQSNKLDTQLLFADLSNFNSKEHEQLYNAKFNRLNPSDTTADEHSSRWLIRNRTFSQQFAPLYYCRLSKLRAAALVSAQAALDAGHLPPNTTMCKKILDLQSSVPCIVAGTLYKEMKLKPSILDELSHTKKKLAFDVAQLHSSTAGVSYASSDDTVLLEDEFGRVNLVCNDSSVFDISKIVSGVVVALCGHQDEDSGNFMITHCFYPQLPAAATSVQRQMLPAGKSHTPAYFLFVSGLSVGNPNAPHIRTQMFVDYVSGVLGTVTEQQHASQIVRVVIAGNLLYKFPKKKTKDFMKEQTDVTELAYPLKQLDMLLTQLAVSCHVDVMAGEDDPANYTLPQQPLHPALFPSAATYNTFHTTTNPMQLKTSINENNRIVMTGTSGQPIADMGRYGTMNSTIDWLDASLQWRHLAPTSPDTLGCYPYEDDDPFTIDEAPHIYFSGNASTFETRLIRRSDKQLTRLLMIPAFSKTGTAVLVDVNSPEFDVQPLEFGVQ